MKKRNYSLAGKVGMLALGLASSTQAATIAWSTVEEITGNTSEIVDAGEFPAISVVTVFDLSGVAQPGISDVAGSGSDITTDSGTFTSGDYFTALNTFDFGFQDVLSSGLEVGETYYVQLFYMDQRSDVYDSRVMTVSDGAGNTADLSSDGEYVIGTFVADSEYQTLEVTGLGGAHLNMIVVSTTASQGAGVGTDTNAGTFVPEPSSLALLGLGGLALVSRRRR